MNNESILNLQKNSLIKRCDEFFNAEKEKTEIERNKNRVTSGIPAFDQIGFLKRGDVTFLVTDEDDLVISNIANSIIVEAVEKQKRVMTIVLDHHDQMLNFKEAIAFKGFYKQNEWFNGKALYVAKYNKYFSFIENLEKIKNYMSKYFIDILFIPNLEEYLKGCDGSTQAEIITYLNKFVADKCFSILTTIQSYSYDNEDEDDERIRFFETEQKFQPYAIKRLINVPTIFELRTVDDELVKLSYFDNFDMCKKKISIKSDNHFYTYNSIKIDYTK